MKRKPCILPVPVLCLLLLSGCDLGGGGPTVPPPPAPGQPGAAQEKAPALEKAPGKVPGKSGPNATIND